MNFRNIEKVITILIIVILYTASSIYADNSYSDKFYKIIPAKARNNGKLGVVVKSLIKNEKIFEYNSNKLFIPASNQKVIVSTVALALLKSDFEFKTEFYIGGENKDGVLHGGLYIKGYGDPTITTQTLNIIAYQFRKKGIRYIKGDIILDDSYFDDLRYPMGWKDEWRDDFYSPPISAISLNYNNIEVVVSPSKNKKKVIVRSEPSSAGVKILNSAKISKKTKNIRAYWAEGGNEIVVSGYLPYKNKEARLKLPVRNPNKYFGNVFKDKLKSHNIKFSGEIKSSRVPRWANLFYTHRSEKLDSIINEYNKNSVNLIGENIIKTLGADYYGAPGTWDKGRKLISLYLDKIGIKNGYRIIDGSGLSLLNRISPNAMIAVLEYAFQNKSIGLDFITSLPVAGIDGTLKKRFKNSEVKGRIVAKTGYLKNVRALSGYVFTNSGDVLVFSILSYGLVIEAKKFQNQLLSELVDCCEKL